MYFMKKLLAYFNNLSLEDRQVFLSKVDGLTENYLRRAVSAGQHFSPLRCVQIEKASNGGISRFDLHPDAKEIWG